MKIHVGLLIVLILLFLCACSTASEPNNTIETLVPETTMEVTEPIQETEPEWFSDDVIEEAMSYIFITEGRKNITLAQELLLPLVEAGNPEAMYYWGYIYDWEIVDNIGEEEKESLYWCKLAAENGFAKAYLAAALNTYTTSDDKTKLIDQAKQAGIFEMSPDELAADGCFYMGSYYYDKEEYDTAMKYFLEASNRGSTDAMYVIGIMYENGIGVKQNSQTAIEWLTKGAKLGDIDAMYNLGNVLDSTEDANELKTAVEWYQKASDAGHAIALNQIAYLYSTKERLSISDYSILEWYKNAANLGSVSAMANLGYIYKQGRHGVYSKDTAMEWFIHAYANGYDRSVEQINDMLSWHEGVNVYFENYGELIATNP